MRYGSVCSGIEAATVAWHPFGWKPVFFAEIEKFPSAVLKHHYADVPNHGDFTTIQEGYYDSIDLLVGGTPCQDFSIAGLRAGMDGARGQLTVEFARLAGRLRPRWLVWENVPGVLSIDGGRAFGTFLGLLGQLGYGVAYRILDAQHFGVPQRRRRVFVVGYLGDWRCAAAVLFERHSLSGHPPPRREKGQEFTHDVAPSLTGSGSGSGSGTARTGESRGQDPIVAVAQTLVSGGTGARGHLDPLNTTLVTVCMSTGQSSAEIGIGIGTTLHCGHEAPIVTHSLRADGFDASEDGTGRGTPLVPLVSNTLKGNRGNGGGGLGPEETLVAFSCKDHGADVGETSPTLRAMGHDGSHANAGGQVAVAFQEAQTGVREYADCGTLRAGGPGHDPVGTRLRIGMAVRRLTPRECERLQGFPDDYTKISDKTADGPRYKALGNSMAVPVMSWIGQRIQAVENLQLIPPHLPTDLPLELCLTEEDLESVGDVDGEV